MPGGFHIRLCLALALLAIGPVAAQAAKVHGHKAGTSNAAACAAIYAKADKHFMDEYIADAGSDDFTPQEKAAARQMFMTNCMKNGPNSSYVRDFLRAEYAQ
jgi:hypothetical protein